MSRSPFGWDLPPGVSLNDIDQAFTDEEERAYDEGMRAAGAGRAMASCPYPPGNLQAAWTDGFVDWEAEVGAS